MYLSGTNQDCHQGEFAEFPETATQGVTDTVVVHGDGVGAMIAAIDAGVGADLIPLGLALGFIFSPELQKHSEYHAALALLEKYFGGKDIDPESDRAWFRAAEGVFLSLSEETLQRLLKRLDMLIADLKLYRRRQTGRASEADFRGSGKPRRSGYSTP
jgi:hypothetical protein